MDDPDTRKQWRLAFGQLIHDAAAYAPRTKSGPDQTVLAKYVYPWARKVALSHDSYFCAKYTDMEVRPFPSRRPRGKCNFVGAPCVEAIMDKIDVDNPKRACPRQCRKKPDWTFC